MLNKFGYGIKHWNSSDPWRQVMSKMISPPHALCYPTTKSLRKWTENKLCDHLQPFHILQGDKMRYNLQRDLIFSDLICRLGSVSIHDLFRDALLHIQTVTHMMKWSLLTCSAAAPDCLAGGGDTCITFCLWMFFFIPPLGVTKVRNVLILLIGALQSTFMVFFIYIFIFFTPVNFLAEREMSRSVSLISVC